MLSEQWVEVGSWFTPESSLEEYVCTQNCVSFWICTCVTDCVCVCVCVGVLLGYQEYSLLSRNVMTDIELFVHMVAAYIVRVDRS